MNKLFVYIKKKYNVDNITLEQAESEGHIEKNIKLLLSIYLDPPNKIKINNQNYPIIYNKWDYKYEKNTNINNKQIPYTFKINVKLFVMDYNKEGTPEQIADSLCRIRKNNIEDDVNEIGFRTKEEVSIMSGKNIDINRTFTKFIDSLKGGSSKRKNKKTKRKNKKKTYKSKNIKR